MCLKWFYGLPPHLGRWTNVISVYRWRYDLRQVSSDRQATYQTDRYPYRQIGNIGDG